MKKYVILAILGLIGYFLYDVAAFYIWKTMDYWERPWAYSRDGNTPLLIGKWEGIYKDPDLVENKIILEILDPEPDSIRWEKASARKSMPSHGNDWKSRFEGTATVSSKLGTEYYAVSGQIKGEKGHRFQLFFTFDQNKKKVLPNFALSVTNEDAKWEGDAMDFLTKFTFYKADGVLQYKSGDPQHNKEVAVHLSRVKM